MNIYFIRHGQTIVNRDGNLSPNSCLSPIGIEQAKKLYLSKALPANPTHVITSPSLQARQTAMYALGHVNEKYLIRLG